MRAAECRDRLLVWVGRRGTEVQLLGVFRKMHLSALRAQYLTSLRTEMG